MRGADLARRHLLRRQRARHAVADEIGERAVRDMLQLAAAAFAEMAARRLGAVRQSSAKFSLTRCFAVALPRAG